MRLFLACSWLSVLSLVAGPSSGQTVNFQTNVGSFDIVLNPTNNPNLNLLADNFLAYVTSGRFNDTVINRAEEDFVLQMGVFKTSSTLVSEIPSGGFSPIAAFAPVIVDSNNDGQVDFSTAGITNVRGTVGLAKAANNQNSGTSSFYINLNNSNDFLDTQGFLTFGTVVDMTPIDQIMSLNRIDLSSTVNQSDSLAYNNVPLSSPGNLVVIQNATVIVPEPGTMILAFSVATAFVFVCGSKRKIRQAHAGSNQQRITF